MKTSQEIYNIGIEAYIYFYPLVLVDVTRRQMTNVNKPQGLFGPMNVFIHAREYPDPSFRGVVRPNFDTLYSSLLLDLTKEPAIITIPDSHGRYYLLQTLDMWTDTFATPGWRTTGTKTGNYAYTSQCWEGKLPEGVVRVKAPTPYIWFIGRTQTNGPEDYAAVHKFQDGMRVTPLSQWGKEPVPVKVVIDSKVDMKTPPMKQVENMTGKDFFEYAARLMKLHPPHITDYSQVWRLERIGIIPGQDFNFNKLESEKQQALNNAAVDGLKTIHDLAPKIAPIVNGWQISTNTVGIYGNYYLKRAVIALYGLGANPAEDAIYPLFISDADGKFISKESNYILHFNKQELPPVDAFWSITLYDKDGFPTTNALNRNNLSSWMPFNYNADGSLDFYFQANSPGKDKESNWIPTPKEDAWNLTMRLYAPKAEVLRGIWNPPPLKRVGVA